MTSNYYELNDELYDDPDEDEVEEKPKKQEGGKYANWCRVEGHPADCSCTLPNPSEIIPMRGATPGTRPMPKDL